MNDTPEQPGSVESGRASFQTFMRDFLNESDRAAVILGAAKLDLLLKQTLERVLLPSASNVDDLLDIEKPLGSFSSRIRAAHRLGVIDTQFSRALHLIRKIRNDFAHEAHGSSLALGSHRDRVRELAAPFLEYVHIDPRLAKLRREVRLSAASFDFRLALAITAARLEIAFVSAQQLASNSPLPLIPVVEDSGGAEEEVPEEDLE